MKKINSGVKFWNKAKKIIPGGSQLLSKRSEMFLPNQWPSYYKKAKGIEIWDLDGNKFIDMSYMGVGSCILGYADKNVNKKVKETVDAGNMTTLNSPEEIELAEFLIKMHPWADNVRYARTGGEAASIAIRIARAYTGKSKVAFCGYHGWHDWYLSSNLSNKKNLIGHLLPGLNPRGVPKELINTAFPFHYNKIGELENIIKKHDIGVIIMEPSRHQEPEDNFLEKVRGISNRIGAVLIFDEISSGFRRNIGGVHLLYKVNPDIAIFGKAMSNGYPMSAVIGKKKIMQAAQDSFISSTYWTERIGPAAALATIKKMQSKKVPKHIDFIGKNIGIGWKKIAKKYNLDINVDGPNPLINFTFNHKDSQKIKTLFTQEMLKRGFLATTTVYVCYSHKKEHIKKYLKSVDEVFNIISQATIKNKIDSLLEGPVAHSGFQRLT
ncbi:MAG: aminotransferase class III-fold pyridoxal phosphate-dependent enzyme [Patescibacteria group bacterium]